MNTPAYTPKPSTTSLQLPEETASLIKASIAENTLKAYQRALQNLSQETVNFPITQATLAGIRRAGRDRGRGQVDGLIWQDVERVYIYPETQPCHRLSMPLLL